MPANLRPCTQDGQATWGAGADGFRPARLAAPNCPDHAHLGRGADGLGCNSDQPVHSIVHTQAVITPSVSQIHSESFADKRKRIDNIYLPVVVPIKVPCVLQAVNPSVLIFLRLMSLFWLSRRICATTIPRLFLVLRPTCRRSLLLMSLMRFLARRRRHLAMLTLIVSPLR